MNTSIKNFVKVRTIKKPWAVCFGEHGLIRGQHELTINGHMVGWFCDSCLSELQLEMERKVAEVVDHEDEI
jgi:hypothetical protein